MLESSSSYDFNISDQFILPVLDLNFYIYHEFKRLYANWCYFEEHGALIQIFWNMFQVTWLNIIHDARA